ncbi:MAG: SIR2 family protein [Sphingomonas sp.]|jgi:hypothetical protein|uniref:SIR2 family protein n=1 Tax=Sphingomonas sp. TaxID=28214 RepID=UPI0035649642
MIEDLARQIRQRRVILFAGAGLSQPLKLPSWDGLIAQMARDLGYDPAVLVGPEANYMQVAEYYALEKGGTESLQAWMRTAWSVDEALLQQSPVHNMIVDLGFPVIYTTNFDENIERIFELRGKRFKRVKSLAEASTPLGQAPHIIKFHGGFAPGDSIVLTESDYYERLEFSSPLDVRLRNDLLTRSVLFVGYSLRDLNLRVLLYKLQKMWAGISAGREKSYIFLLRPDPVQQRVLQSRGIHPIVAKSADAHSALEQFFEELLGHVRTPVARRGQSPRGPASPSKGRP